MVGTFIDGNIVTKSQMKCQGMNKPGFNDRRLAYVFYNFEFITLD